MMKRLKKLKAIAPIVAATLLSLATIAVPAGRLWHLRGVEGKISEAQASRLEALRRIQSATATMAEAHRAFTAASADLSVRLPLAADPLPLRDLLLAEALACDVRVLECSFTPPSTISPPFRDPDAGTTVLARSQFRVASCGNRDALATFLKSLEGTRDLWRVERASLSPEMNSESHGLWHLEADLTATFRMPQPSSPTKEVAGP